MLFLADSWRARTSGSRIARPVIFPLYNPQWPHAVRLTSQRLQQTMITGEIKSRVDQIWDTMWSGGIANPLTVIEQLTYLLFIKRLDELHTLRENQANRTGRPIEDPIFAPEQDQLRWSRFRQTAPEPMYATVRDEVFPFIKTLGKSEHDGEEDATYTKHMENAVFMMP